MLMQFIESYQELSDSIITELMLRRNPRCDEHREIEIAIYCKNVLSLDYTYDTVRVIFLRYYRLSIF